MIDIESTLISWLTAKGYSAYADVPKTRPNEFLTVELTGESERNAVSHSTLAIQCWATSRFRASEVSKDLVEAIKNFRFVSGVCSVSVNTRYNFPDVESGTPRYQVVIDVVHK